MEAKDKKQEKQRRGSEKKWIRRMGDRKKSEKVMQQNPSKN